MRETGALVASCGVAFALTIVAMVLTFFARRSMARKTAARKTVPTEEKYAPMQRIFVSTTEGDWALHEINGFRIYCGCYIGMIDGEDDFVIPLDKLVYVRRIEKKERGSIHE